MKATKKQLYEAAKRIKHSQRSQEIAAIKKEFEKANQKARRILDIWPI